MNLFLRADLVKSAAAPAPSQKAGAAKPVGPGHGRGETRGGHYVAREQIGFEEDGSPKYRYFSTEEEHQSFLKHRGKATGTKELKTKVKEEHADSTKKVKESAAKEPKETKRPNLLAGSDEKKKPVEKSLSLYIRNK